MNAIRVVAGGPELAGLLRRLASFGIGEDESGRDSPSPIVLCCDDLSSDPVERVRKVNSCGLARVIVVGKLESLPEQLPWQLVAAGADEVLDIGCVEQAALAISARMVRWAEIDRLVASAAVHERLVGSSPAFVRALRQIVEIAAFTDAGVLLLGESGTGKEQLARLIHELDQRAGKRAFVTLDCTTVVPELSGSEFFGHERGAFTGAVQQREGAFALADQGTLFLDEVGELPTTLQAQLLRAVQERTYKRVGGNHWYQADFRLVAATNRDLAAEVEAQAFRGDFYHRIASWVVHLPPLRQRPEDIIPLAEHFARQHFGPGSEVQFDRRTREFLCSRSYPGNVRELRQVVTRICGRHVGSGPLTIGDIAPSDRPPPDAPLGSDLQRAVQRAVLGGAGLKEIGKTAREVAIGTALQASAQNVQQAARLLKVTDRALQMELAKRDA